MSRSLESVVHAPGVEPALTSGARLERVVQGASFGMLILGSDRRIELANGRARTLILGAHAQGVEGRLLGSVAQPELRSALEGIVSAVFRERRMVEADRLPAAGGRVVDVVGYPVDDEGVARHVVLVANDITERLALEGQLLQSSKLATIGELAAGVAHEINNPTAFVHSNLRTMQRYWTRLETYLALAAAFSEQVAAEASAPLQEAARGLLAARESLKIDSIALDQPQALAESIDGTSRIQKIVQDLKSFARPDDAQFREVELGGVIERALRLVANEVKYVAEVVRELAPVPPVLGNASQLSQVLVNLLMNAVQAIEGRGCITVRTRVQGDEVHVDVQDDGSGISPIVLPRIFDPFFTTKPPGRGTGLGLSVSYGIVERHQGRIRVETEEGKGSCFTVVLRRAPEGEPAPGAPGGNQ